MHTQPKPVADHHTRVMGFRMRETQAAILIQITEVDGEKLPIVEEHWFPISQVPYAKIARHPEESEFHVATWLLRKKGYV